MVNGTQVATGRLEHTNSVLFGAETADVDVDFYTPVTPEYKKGDNQFTGKIYKITIDLKRMNVADEDTAEKAAENTRGVRADQN